MRLALKNYRPLWIAGVLGTLLVGLVTWQLYFHQTFSERLFLDATFLFLIGAIIALKKYHQSFRSQQVLWSLSLGLLSLGSLISWLVLLPN